ncbi:MAG TPA: hypothetical protein DEQ98_14875, partial [Acidobacteria bacterium]|nr:hypothetical protein [Acidobacteriota bacterium]
DHPALRDLDLPPLGQSGRVSPLVTRSLIFLGQGVDRGMVFLPEGVGGKSLRAYDKETGAVVAEVALPGGTSAAPITYMAGGKQHIVVTVGWTDMESEWVALALP